MFSSFFTITSPPSINHCSDMSMGVNPNNSLKRSYSITLYKVALIDGKFVIVNREVRMYL